MADKPAPLFSSLVGELYELDAQIAVLKTERDEVAAKLIEKGEGTYCDQSDPPRSGIVVVPTKFSTKYDLYKPEAFKAFLAANDAKKSTPALVEAFKTSQEERARALAGDNFKSLFDREVIFTPADGFEKLVPKFLTTAKGDPAAAARDLLLHCQIVKAPADPSVRLTDKPKAAAPGDSED